MVPGKYNFKSQVRGDTILSRTITVNIDSNPAEFASAAMNVRNSQGRLIENITLSFTDNVITIPNIDTTAWPIQTLKYDIQVTSAAGVVRTYIQGLIPIKEDYTYV